MKNRLFILFALIGLSTFTVTNVYAQRHGGGHSGGGHFGGGSHFGGGFSAPHHMTAPRMSAPRISAPRVVAPRSGYYYHSAPVIRGHLNYPVHPWYRYGYRPWRHWFFPRIGIYFSTLPFGYYALDPFFYGPVYYSEGSYYELIDERNEYKVVEAPMGAAVPDIPDGSVEVIINGKTYYDVNGTYYQETVTNKGKRYVVVGKDDRSGDKTVTYPNDQVYAEENDNQDLITSLPDDCTTATISGSQYFVSPDGVYYQAVVNSDNSIAGYKTVGKVSSDN